MSDERIKKAPGEDREDRKLQDRAATENREISEADRLEMFRQTFHQAHLPDLPAPAGYKVTWLTTTNPRDSIPARLRLGYELLRPEDVPGYPVEQIMMKTGEFSGHIMINEMIAAKLPIALYNLYMKESHSTRPLQEEERMNAPLKAIEEAAAELKLKVKTGDEVDSWA